MSDDQQQEKTPPSPGEEYHSLMHQMQSAIAMCIGLGIDIGASPKHLRVGVNSALIDSGALADLLLKKGLITKEEFGAMVVEKVRADVEDYKERLRQHLGRPVDVL